MKCKVIPYRIITGTKTIIQAPRKRRTQWIVYQNDTAKFFIDLFDLKKNSNIIMNSLIFCGRKSIDDILKIISHKNNICLSIPKAPFLGFKVKLEFKEFHLEPMPEEGLSYSL
jgi:hypothetical protein